MTWVKSELSLFNVFESIKGTKVTVAELRHEEETQGSRHSRPRTCARRPWACHRH